MYVQANACTCVLTFCIVDIGNGLSVLVFATKTVGRFCLGVKKVNVGQKNGLYIDECAIIAALEEAANRSFKNRSRKVTSKFVRGSS
jgi:hypothetical protein